MQTRYGVSMAQWERARAEMRDALIDTARQKMFITYSDLVARVRSLKIPPHSHALATMLGEISSAEHECGRGMLSALVLSKDGGEPGSGFYSLAERLGRDVSDRERFWLAEFNRVHADWAVDEASG